ncbi:MAG: DUF2723 domain-containing protein [Bacteroidota bacterium]|nr:DUF2723 domain-containing protein [Bacteroidota bacterium]
MSFKITITLVIIFFVYFINSNTSIGFGDALGFVWASECCFQLGTNATSHFLYVNFLRLLVIMFSYFDAFQIASFVSILFSLITLLLVYCTSFKISDSSWASVISVIILAFSFTYWRQTEIVEVYTFNLAFLTLLFFLSTIVLIDESKRQIIFLISILMGISLWIHIQNILIFPAFIYLCYVVDKQWINVLVKLIPASLIGLLLFVLPFITNQNSVMSVLVENTFFLSKAIDHDVYYYFNSLLKNVGFLLYNLHLFLFFSIWGLIKLFKKYPRVGFFYFLVGLPYFVFPIFYDVPDNYVFALVFYLVLAITSVFGIDDFIKKQFIQKLKIVVVLVAFTLSPALYFSVYKLSENISHLDKIKESKAYKGGFKYLLWPGMRNNVSLIEYSKYLNNSNEFRSNFEEFKWNYDLAMAYIKWKNKENL